MEHLVSIHDISDDQLRAIMDRAASFEGQNSDVLADRIVCTAFFEPSTRTRLSFETAARRLGADVVGFSDGKSTSSSKGESLEDTIKVMSGYGDIIVMRHPEKGAAKRAAAVATVPVINAGDGDGEHPTQTLLDLYTMRKHLGQLMGKKVALVGDLRYGRTVHSLVPALRRLGVDVMTVPAPGLELPDEVGEVPVVSLEEAARKADVLYVTRVQRERFADEAAYKAAAGKLIVNADLLKRTNSTAIVMHPLPRVDEVDTDVDALPAAKYFDQARNGVPVRMAVLAMLLEASQ